MGTLYIDRKDLELRVEGHAIAFYSGNQREGVVPLAPLNKVIILGNIHLQTSFLHKLAMNNISVIFLSGRRMKYSGRLSGRIHKNGLLRLKQYEKAQSIFARKFSSEIIETKLRKQLAFFDEVLSRRKDLKLELSKAVEILNSIVVKVAEPHNQESLRGFEGSAASAFFKAYATLFAPSLGFGGRARRPPPDPVNALLSLTYTLVHFEMVREIEIIGLDPCIGFYHSFEYGRESLACDLVEVFRPDVERIVYALFRNRKLDLSDFSQSESGDGCYLKKASRKTYFFLYEDWAQQMRSEWRDCVRSLARRIADGEVALFD